MSSRQDTNAQGILFIVLFAGFLAFTTTDAGAETVQPHFELLNSDEPISWFAAQDSAASYGGYLAIITSAAEQAQVAALLSESDTAWLGGFDVLIEGVWVWLNGEAWTYSYWNVPHPWPSQNYDYLQIMGSTGGQWESAASHTSAYVVEYECCIGLTGNIDSDSEDAIDISDLVYLVDYMFTGGPAPTCINEADLDLSNGIDISDLVYLVDFMFTGGPAPLPCPALIVPPSDTVILTDNTGKQWDISYAVHFYGFDRTHFNFGLGPNAIPPIINPAFLTAADSEFPDPQDSFMILGTTINDDTRAYPWDALIGREVVDDTFDSVYIAATY